MNDIEAAALLDEKCPKFTDIGELLQPGALRHKPILAPGHTGWMCGLCKKVLTAEQADILGSPVDRPDIAAGVARSFGQLGKALAEKRTAEEQVMDLENRPTLEEMNSMESAFRGDIATLARSVNRLTAERDEAKAQLTSIQKSTAQMRTGSAFAADYLLALIARSGHKAGDPDPDLLYLNATAVAIGLKALAEDRVYELSQFLQKRVEDQP